MRGFGEAVSMMSHAVVDAVEGSIVAERHAQALRGQGERLRALVAGLPDVVRRMTESARDARRWYDEVSDVVPFFLPPKYYWRLVSSSKRT